jgi:hypothetical protein
MTNDEKAIMGDMFYFLRDHNDPPAVGTNACTTFWEKAAEDISALVGTKWNNHPLAMEIGIALYNYLEKKCKAKGGGSA